MPVGGGTRIHIGHQPSKDIVELSTASLNNIVEYNPDDLVVIAEAGMTLSALQLKLKEHGQWLPIDISAPERQTLGGIVASRANSLLRSGCGSVRDWLIGVELVNADADIVIGGGNARRVERLPAGTRLGDNRNASLGGLRLWGLGSGWAGSKACPLVVR